MITNAKCYDSSVKSFLLLVLASLIFINPLFWMSAFFADFQRPLFNMDYTFVVFLIFLMRNKSNLYLIPVAVITIILFSLDLMGTISTVYVFASFRDILGLLHFLNYANHFALGILVALVLIILLFLWIIKRVFKRFSSSSLPQDKGILFWLLILLLTVGGGVKLKATDYETIKSNLENNVLDPNAAWIMEPVNPVFGSQLYFIYASMHTGFKDARAQVAKEFSVAVEDPKKPWPAPVASDAIDINKDKRVLLIVVESFGFPSDMDNFSKLYPSMNKFASLLPNTQLDSIFTSGVTVSNEIRELCKIVLTTPDPTYIKNFEACLPYKMKKRGIKTVSMHAASKGMYDRDVWYKQMGFDESFFLENSDNLGKSYSFPGGQDTKFMPKLKELLNDNPESLFAYWLTLNSHFPYDSRDSIDSTYKCPQEFTEQLCHYAKIHDKFFNALYETIKDEKNLKVIITGDHMPPFMKRVDQEYFIRDAVPGIVIEL